MLTVADRRNITSWAMIYPDFKADLIDQPRATIERATGKTLPEGARVELVHEQMDDWCVVLPSPDTIDADLPDADDPRTAMENAAFRLYRNDPAAAALAERDVTAFAAEHLGFDLSQTRLRLHREAPGTIAILVPDYRAADELPDEMLDAVSGGGAPPAQGGVPMKGERG